MSLILRRPPSDMMSKNPIKVHHETFRTPFLFSLPMVQSQIPICQLAKSKNIENLAFFKMQNKKSEQSSWTKKLSKRKTMNIQFCKTFARTQLDLAKITFTNLFRYRWK
jgi:hypothetical protein